MVCVREGINIRTTYSQLHKYSIHKMFILGLTPTCITYKYFPTHTGLVINIIKYY